MAKLESKALSIDTELSGSPDIKRQLFTSKGYQQKHKSALTGVAQCVGHHTAKQQVAGLIPSHGTHLG